MNKVAIIVAGGTGQRMGTSLPKQFLPLNGQPILWHTITAFLSAFTDISIVLVLPAEFLASGHELVSKSFVGKDIKVIEGGATRFQSVKNGLAFVNNPSVVFIHDGVRCLVSPALITQCYETALEKGSAVPVVASKDSIRLATERGSEALDRNKVLLVQTPQTFLSNLLLSAYQVDYQEKFTDDAAVVESAGYPIHLVNGEERNIKITHPIDLLIAEQLLTKG
jgi:2-C-methyl-D-erythritol 4-phosphate cytidylyltransferase